MGCFSSWVISFVLLTGQLPVETGPTLLNLVNPDLLGMLNESGLMFLTELAEGVTGHDQLDGQILVVDGKLELDIAAESLSSHPYIGLADMGDVFPHLSPPLESAGVSGGLQSLFAQKLLADCMPNHLSICLIGIYENKSRNSGVGKIDQTVKSALPNEKFNQIRERRYCNYAAAAQFNS
jgi:hypothetical protein